jgi:hypothetical protein
MTLPFIKALILILNHSESSLHMFDSVILQTFPSQDHTARTYYFDYSCPQRQFEDDSVMTNFISFN